MMILNIMCVLGGVIMVASTYKAKKTGVIKTPKYELTVKDKDKAIKEYIIKEYISMNYKIGLMCIIQGIVFIIDEYHPLQEMVVIIPIISFIILAIFAYKTIKNMLKYKDRNK